MHRHTARIAELAVFTAVAFIFSYIESLFPLPIPFPGIKLGFANLIIVIVLYRDGFPAALGVSLVRNLLNALTFGSLFGFLYSLAGSVLSLCAMYLLRKGFDADETGNKRLGERASDGAKMPDAVSGTFPYKKKRPRLSLIGISAVGGILHNAGQFIVASCLVGFTSLLGYLPFLYFAGLVAGALIGALALLCLQRLPRQIRGNN